MGASEGDFRICRKILKRGSKTFFFASKILPQNKARAFSAVYAFCKLTDDIADEGAATGEERLQQLEAWKRGLLSAYGTGKSDHPALRAFSQTARHYRIPLSLPLRLISAVVSDARHAPFRTFRQLRKYCCGVASVVGLMLLHVMGVRSRRAQKYAIYLGIAMQLTNILRDVEEDLLMGRLYVPSEELADYGLLPEDVSPQISGSKAERFRKLVEFQVCRARHYYSQSLRGLRYLPARLRFAIATCALLYSQILDQIEGRDYEVFGARKPGMHRAIFGLGNRIT